MTNKRLFYKKTGSAKYISHLDMNRMMLRTIQRGKIPVWRTAGFNPHPFITFALPLSLGFTSEYDIMDFKVEQDIGDNILLRLFKESLPEQIIAIEVADPIKKAKEIKYTAFKTEFQSSEANKIRAFLEAENIFVDKTTKKKKYERLDIKPKIAKMKLEQNVLSIILPAGSEENLNPNLLFDAMKKTGIDFDIINVTRTAILDRDRKLFR